MKRIPFLDVVGCEKRGIKEMSDDVGQVGIDRLISITLMKKEAI